MALRQTDINGAEISSRTVESLAAGTNRDVVFTWHSVQGDTVTAFGVLDPANAIDEFDEDNNTATIRIEMDSDFDGIPNATD